MEGFSPGLSAFNPKKIEAANRSFGAALGPFGEAWFRIWGLGSKVEGLGFRGILFKVV